MAEPSWEILLRRHEGSSTDHVQAIGFAGLGIFYAAYAGQVVPHLTSLGIPDAQVSFTLLSGPICGAVLQPLFGRWSDRCQSRWGRRRPFVAIGSICAILAMLLLAFATRTMEVVMPNSSLEDREDAIRSLSMMAVFLSYAASQAIQVGMRTLITDGCSPKAQAVANAWAGRYIGLGSVLENLAAFRYAVSAFSDEEGSPTVLAGMTVLTIICLAVSASISCWRSTPRHRLDQRVAESTSGILSPLPPWDRRKSVFWNSRSLGVIFLIQALSWLGWFPFYYCTVTFLDDFPLTDRHKSSVQHGTEKLGSLAFLSYSIAALFASVILPMLSISDDGRGVMTMRQIWILSNTVFGSCMLATLVVPSARLAVLLFTMPGFSWAVTNWVPFALLGDVIVQFEERSAYSGDKMSTEQDGSMVIATSHAGFIYGMHGLSVCIPQILMALLMGVSSSLGSPPSALEQQSNIARFLAAGGLCAFAAMLCAVWFEDLGVLEDEQRSCRIDM